MVQRLSVGHLGPHSNLTTATGRITCTFFFADIHGPQRMKTTCLCNVLTYCIVPPAGGHLVKRLKQLSDGMPLNVKSNPPTFTQ